MNNIVYLASLDRFGYDLLVIAEDEKTARYLLTREYIRAYKDITHTDPADDLIADTETSYLQCAQRDIQITEIRLNEVVWR